MSAKLLSIATATPEGTLAREEWTRLAPRIVPDDVPRAVIERLAERSGIDVRGCAATPPGGPCFYPDADAPGSGAANPGTFERMALWRDAGFPMALRAATAAIERAGIPVTAFTHCITASCTGYESPGIDAHLVERLGLPRTCRRLNIGHMGCHAAVNALACARDAVLANPAACVLVTCTEVSSAHFHRSARMDRLVADTIFADGCASAVVAGAAHRGVGHEIAAVHTVLIPETADEMRWTVGNHGFEMTLGARVPDILRMEVGPWVQQALGSQGLRTDEVGGWAIHPGGPRVIDAVCEALSLAPGSDVHSRAVLREHGNMSSATLLFILERMRAAGVPGPWVGLAFGPGLVGELVLVRPSPSGHAPGDRPDAR
jgi:predicted naringenin-chalcone synthase